jgi:hypothetical protein
MPFVRLTRDMRPRGAGEIVPVPEELVADLVAAGDAERFEMPAQPHATALGERPAEPLEPPPAATADQAASLPDALVEGPGDADPAQAHAAALGERPIETVRPPAEGLASRGRARQGYATKKG